MLASRIINHFELDGLISTVYGSELDGRYSDKSYLIARILDETRLKPTDCLMNGDRKHDIIGVLTNRVSAIGVLWGFDNHSELAKVGASMIAAAPNDLDALAHLGDTHER